MLSQTLFHLLPLLVTVPLATWAWRRFTRQEVAVNAAMIDANGSADDLRRGFHQRRGWIRFWPWLALSLGGAAPLLWGGHWVAFGLGFLAVGLLLATYFARYFTPWLNLAMGLAYKPEFYCSLDSASWPDAAVVKQLRAIDPTAPAAILQVAANNALRELLLRVWLWGWMGAAGLFIIVIYLLYR